MIDQPTYYESQLIEDVNEKTFERALKSLQEAPAGANLLDLLHQIRKAEFKRFIDNNLTRQPAEELKLAFYIQCEKPCEHDFETILALNKTHAFKENAGAQLRQTLTKALPRSFLGSSSFSKLMESLFDWSLAIEHMSNMIIKANYYVMDFSDDLKVKPKQQAQFSKISAHLSAADITFLFILKTIKFVLKHIGKVLPFGGHAKSALKQIVFLLLTSSLSIPTFMVKASMDSLSFKMLAPPIMFLLTYFEKYISKKLIEVVDEKEADIYAQALIKEIGRSLEFLIKMKAKLSELFSEYSMAYFDKRDAFKASELKVMIVRIIEGFLMGKEVDFDSFDEFLAKEKLLIVGASNGWIIVDELQ